MTTNFLRRSTRILVVNPNSSKSMTHGVEQAIASMQLADVRHTTPFLAHCFTKTTHFDPFPLVNVAVQANKNPHQNRQQKSTPTPHPPNPPPP